MRGRRGARGALVAVLAVALLLVLLPEGVRWQAERWLRAQGVSGAQVGDVDLDLFRGHLALRDVVLENGGPRRAQLRRLELTLDYRPLFERRVAIASLRLAGFEGDLELAPEGVRLGPLLLAGGGEERAREAATARWSLGLGEARLEQVELRLHGRQPARIEIERLALGAVAQWRPGQAGRVALRMKIDGAPLVFEGRIAPFAPAVDGRLRLDGLALAPFGHWLAAQGIEALEGALGIDAELTLNGTRLEMEGAVAITGPRLRHGGRRVVLERLRWQGGAAFGEGRMQLSGKVDGGAGEVVDEGLDLALARWQGIGLEGVGLEDGTLAVAGIALAGLEALGEPDGSAALARARQVQLGPLRLEAGRVELERIAADELVLDLRRDEDGALRWIDRIGSGSASAAADEGEGAGSPFTFRVGTVEIGGASRLRFEDRAVIPAVSIELADLRLKLGTLDSLHPERRTPLELALVPGPYARFEALGEVAPLARPPVVDLAGRLEGFDLTPLSPYAVVSIGYALRRGRLDDDFTLVIGQGRLRADNRLRITALDIAAADAERAARFDASLAMPLDAALGLLEDGDGSIVFDLPVSGDPSAPEFSLAGVVDLALGKALRAAAINYAVNALQPLGTLILVGKAIGKATEPRFAPLRFAPGDTVPGEQGRGYLERLAGLLRQRPRLRLTLCGIATEADRALLAHAGAGEGEPPPEVGDERLLALARARADGIKAALVEEGIEPERLFDCRPAIDPEGAEGPRVEISL